MTHEPFRHSLLDRFFLGLDPRSTVAVGEDVERADEADTHARRVSELEEGVMRNVRALIDRRVQWAFVDELAAAGSEEERQRLPLLRFGLPDFVEGATAAGLHGVCKGIVRAVTTSLSFFEPRLRDPEVTVDVADGQGRMAGRRVLRMTIRGRLAVDEFGDTDVTLASSIQVGQRVEVTRAGPAR